MPTDDALPLTAEDAYRCLARRPDGALACLWLSMLMYSQSSDILSIKRRPASVQIACRRREEGLADSHWTVDIPLVEIAPERMLDVTFYAHTPAGMEIVYEHRTPPEAIPLARAWRP